jgi:hypothetical protein
MSRQPQTLCAIHHYLCAIASLLCVQSPAYRVVDLQSVKDYPSSLTGKARKSLGNGKLFGVRETTPPAATRDLPITLRTKSRWIASPRSGSSAASPQTVPGVSAGIHNEVPFSGSVAPDEQAARPRGTAFAVRKLGEDECRCQ